MWIWDVPHRLQCWCNNTWLQGSGAVCRGHRTFKTHGLASRIGLLLVEPGGISSLVWPETSASYLMLKWRSPCCSHLLLWMLPCCPCLWSSKMVSQDKPVFSQELLQGILSQQWERGSMQRISGFNPWDPYKGRREPDPTELSWLSHRHTRHMHAHAHTSN